MGDASNPRKERVEIALDALNVPAKSTMRVSVDPLCLFRCDGLLVDGDVTDLELTTLKIANEHQLPCNVNAVRLITFDKNQRQPELQCDTCPPGRSIVLKIKNNASAVRAMGITLTGYTLTGAKPSISHQPQIEVY